MIGGVSSALAQEQALGPGSPLQAYDANPTSAVRDFGVTGMPGVLSPQTASELFIFVQSEFARSCALVDPASRRECFSAGLFQQRASADQPQTRWDLKLPLAPIVRKALRELLFGPTSHLGAALMSLAGGSEAELWELAAIISAPGAVPQVVHRDTEYSEEPCLFTAFVALHDVSREMGPTRFLLGSHTQAAQMRFDSDPAAFLSTADSVVSILKTGDASLFDSRLLHCGGANRSNSFRVLLTVTFRHVHAPPWLESFEQSLRPIYKTFKLQLRQFSHLSEGK